MNSWGAVARDTHSSLIEGQLVGSRKVEQYGRDEFGLVCLYGCEVSPAPECTRKASVLRRLLDKDDLFVIVL